ncbi:hypothetical protein CNEO4_810021 [Clostridium neonatale]|nr:hypothetical protein CNEO3_10226 [Clostridium neonatale]CAI3691013.1 hypothetical protein CNEO4_50155 [Clostridium neonatale]CAI3701803.1 hypothetical protein CNEO4_810021 [Clostridium neonatale]
MISMIKLYAKQYFIKFKKYVIYNLNINLLKIKNIRGGLNASKLL